MPEPPAPMTTIEQPAAGSGRAGGIRCASAARTAGTMPIRGASASVWASAVSVSSRTKPSLKPALASVLSTAARLRACGPSRQSGAAATATRPARRLARSPARGRADIAVAKDRARGARRGRDPGGRRRGRRPARALAGRAPAGPARRRSGRRGRRPRRERRASRRGRAGTWEGPARAPLAVRRAARRRPGAPGSRSGSRPRRSSASRGRRLPTRLSDSRAGPSTRGPPAAWPGGGGWISRRGRWKKRRKPRIGELTWLFSRPARERLHGRRCPIRSQGWSPHGHLPPPRPRAGRCGRHSPAAALAGARAAHPGGARGEVERLLG